MYLPVMLARPMPDNFLEDISPRKRAIFQPGEWAAEEKFDGHRIEVAVGYGTGNLFNSSLTAYSRLPSVRQLPTHILEALAKFPRCHLDGELLAPGKRSYGVTELVNSPDLIYFVFDILTLEGNELLNRSYESRRDILEDIFQDVPDDLSQISNENPVQLAASTNVNTWDEVTALRDAVWARDGEGLILKQRVSPYMLGKRSKSWIKIKDLKTAVVRVVQFLPSKGLINDRGPCAMVLVEDEDGNRTTVKTRNDALCVSLAAMFKNGVHPFIGRELRIEYQERTPDGSYRHPRWDRWENE